jgi:hypothetical protein
LLFTDASLQRERRLHRNLAHAGHIPDGERVIHVEPSRLADVPREQLIACVVLFVAAVVFVLVRLN